MALARLSLRVLCAHALVVHDALHAPPVAQLEMELRPIEQEDRRMVDEFIMRRWFTLQMVVHGVRIDLAIAEGLCATDAGELVGLVTYRFHDTEMEILSLDSAQEGMGIGTMLLEAAVETARKCNCSRVKLITTNDNTAALRFYQRRGFDMVCLYRNALEQSRRLKPEIPLIGEDGIPLRHEIELELAL